MALQDVITAVYESAFSEGIRQITWVIPTVQSLHIVGIAVLAGSALVMELRLGRVFATDIAPSVVVRRHLPWLWSALGLLLATGLIMVIGEPDRVLGNRVFWWKMVLVAIAFLVTLFLRRPLLRTDPGAETANPGLLIVLSAWISILIWIAVIFCGRWIAYLV